jgi:hypothetical protein
MMESVLGKKFQWIEMVFNAAPNPGNAQMQLNFGPQNFLNGANIRSIEVLASAEVPTSPQFNPLVSAAQLGTMFLTLYMNDPDNPKNSPAQSIYNYPLILLHRIQTGNTAFVRELQRLNNPIIQWEKSFITLTAPLNNINNNLAVLFNVGYQGGNSV